METKNGKRSTTEIILYVTAFAAVIVCAYSILTYGRTVVHSDTATATLLARAQLKYKQFYPDSWCYINGDLWTVSPNLFVLPFAAFLKDQSLARMLGSLLMVLCTCLAIAAMSRSMFKNRFWLIGIPVFLFCTFGIYDTTDPFSWDYDMLLYQAAYTLFIMCITVCLMLVYQALEDGDLSLKKSIVPVLVLFLVSMGGMRYLAELTVPLAGCFALSALAERFAEKKSDTDIRGLITRILFVSVPSLAGCLVSRAIYNRREVFNTNSGYPLRFISSGKELLDNLTAMLLDFYRNFGYTTDISPISIRGVRNIVSFVMCTLIVFVIPILQARVIKTEPRPVRFLFLFGLIHNAEMIALVVLFGMTTYRYLLTSVFICEMISAVYVYDHVLNAENAAKNKKVTAIVFALFVAVYAFVMLDNTRGWKQDLTRKKQLCDELKSRGLTKGYAPYWSAYTYEVYSDGQIRMMSLSPDPRNFPENEKTDMISQDWWLTDSNNYFPEDGIRTFFISDDTIDEIKRERLLEIYGDPSDMFEYNDMTVYIWDYDIARHMLNGYADGKLSPNDMMVAGDTESSTDRIVLNKDSVVHGPYIPIEKGEYRFDLKGEGLENAVFEARSYSVPESVSYTEIERDDEHIVIDAVLTETVNDFTIRLINAEDTPIVYDEIYVTRK